MVKKIYNSNNKSICFFRSTVLPPEKKIMIQVTDRCNMKCVHCFAEAKASGCDMSFETIKNHLLPKLLECHTTKVTITGGEPFVHSEIEKIITLFLLNNISVSICTNGALIKPEFIRRFKEYKENLHFNVSLDGFSEKSYCNFRGINDVSVYGAVINNIILLGKAKLLNGILITPNKFSTIDEYVQLCLFARKIGARYVLMNPLSPFGRGYNTMNLGFSEKEMTSLRENTINLITNDFEIDYIRFPNAEMKPISLCPLGEVPYVFCNGDIAICPYIVFAANGNNRYNYKDFILGNINDKKLNIATSIDTFMNNANPPFSENFKSLCNRGCFAMKVANNCQLDECEYCNKENC